MGDFNERGSCHRRLDMRVLTNERGSVLIVVFLILLLASTIAIFSTNTTTLETQIASNEKAYSTVFYAAEAGIAPGVKILRDTVSNRAVGSYGAGITWTADTLEGGVNNLLKEVLGSEDSANGSGFTFQSGDSGLTTTVRIQREGATTESTGGSTEFNTGSEGIGYGSMGGVQLIFAINSTGSDPMRSQSQVQTQYRKVIRGTN